MTQETTKFEIIWYTQKTRLQFWDGEIGWVNTTCLGKTLEELDVLHGEEVEDVQKIEICLC